ncbi:MAG: hypothetical protein FWG44_01235 [Oscillospiraceae bacterium]|nr:hypothetical protein [Oscillospiraceae bacterium]
MAGNTGKVTALIGDFYEGHANKDFYKMSTTLETLDALLMTGEDEHAEFMAYFNEMFSGRTAFNTLLNLKDYPVESIIRELFQNAFDCDYDEDDVKIAVNFKDNHTISISYNEVGFILEQFMFYLSFGRNTKNAASSEGRFGVGAKSVFMNVEWLSMRSNNFSFCIMNNDGLLKITDINLRRPIFKGTEIVIKVDPEQHKRIKENFINLTSDKGDYISLVELCFAFNRKKILNNKKSTEMNDKRTFNIAVMNNGKLIEFYKVYNHYNKAVDVNVVRFTQGGKSVVDFICYENDGFVYLIPFALAMSKRADMVKLLTEKYNFFSTYELTGLIKSEDTGFNERKLSAFFISVPNRHITSFRTGIRPDREFEVISHVEESVKKIISDYERFFVLGLHPNADGDGFYHLLPESYAFEFIKNFILTGNFPEELRKSFLGAVSLRYNKGEEPLHYSDMQKLAYFSSIKQVPNESHWNGAAYQEFINAKLESMNRMLGSLSHRILYAGYEWEPPVLAEGEELQEGNEGGVTYLYEFHKDGNVMYISSENNPAFTDYDLFDGFMSLAERVLSEALNGGDSLQSGEQFEKLLASLDDMYHGEYRIALKDGKLYVLLSTDEFPIETSNVKVKDIQKLIKILQKHKRLFLTYQDYSETVKLMLDAFAEGRPVAEFLRALKEQGAEITVQPDIDNNYCFSVYETMFMISPEITNAELIEIIGDINALIKSGVLNGRTFGFIYDKGRYNFEPQKVVKILASDELAEADIVDLFGKIQVAELKSNKVALLGENDVIVDIVDIQNGIDAEKRALTQKYIILREDYLKEEFADIIEIIITGENKNLMRRRYMGAAGAKIVIPDQLAFYLKPLPSFSKEEFGFLRSVARDITENELNARNYFAKDVNAKLFGYGGSCSFCGFESEGINGFTVRDFEVEIMYGEHERHFNFSLYLCADDTALCDSWVFDDLSISGMPPFEWLDKIQKAERITSELLQCTLTYREQITHDMPDSEESFSGKLSATKKTVKMILSPLAAADWVEKNKDNKSGRNNKK